MTGPERRIICYDLKAFSVQRGLIGGRNSAVECQLPKLDVVGSSPIARSIFLLLLFTPIFLRAQVTTDIFQPFHQGQAIELPGTTEYMGDLPQEATWVDEQEPFHTVDGVLARSVGWVGPGTPAALGISGGSPGVLFEGIPYPLESAEVLNWLPVSRDMELLDFPAAAWWGPTAATGAVQIRLPDTPGVSPDNLDLWGGSVGMGGGEGFYFNPFFSAEGDAQHGFLNGSPSDTLRFLSGWRWASDDPVVVQSGILGSQWFGGDDWYSFFTSLKWESPDFQTIELKPFVQTARLDGLEVLEYGGQVNYHLNMAGALESQLGAGFSHDDFSSMPPPGLNREYLQNTETFDVLGNFLLNTAFRWDFSQTSSVAFSTILGCQYLLGDLQLVESYDKAVDPISSQDIREEELGFRYQPDAELASSVKFVDEWAGTNSWTGGRIKIQWAPAETTLFAFQELHLEVEEEFLENPSGTSVWDTGGQVSWNFFQPLSFRLGGRGISGQVFHAEMGTDCRIMNRTKIFVSAENVTNSPVSWPDPTAPTGRILWLGVETSF